MSTSYYVLRKPWTHIEAEASGRHTRVRLWVNHVLTGVLILRNEELKEVLWSFFGGSEEPCPLHTWWGGPERGTVVDEHGLPLPDEAPVLSEYGELLTAGRVRARSGARRADGMPTELFGYEEGA